ncbi:MAG: Gfo/Idh/MocA family oxidoreductase [Oscillospiraceae bacterium]|jgi:predicted dehydrogenase|nr:Gfo/Idh/MocA family oxidoreductase [Oscillospiraceae bacterium]
MITVGVLGNNFGKYHAQLYKRIDGFEVKQIFGRDDARLQQTAKELGIATTNDIQSVITDPAIDLIDICLPTPLHFEYALEALRHGKHVLCETPLAITVEEALGLQQASEQCGRMVFVDLFYKFSSAHSKAMSLLQNEKLGDIRSATLYNRTAAVWGNLNVEKNISDFHIHNLDFVLEVLGLPGKVSTHAMGFGDASFVATVLQYDHQMAAIESSSHLPKGSPFCIGFEIICENGAIVYSGEYGSESSERFTLSIDGEKSEIQLAQTDDYELVLRHVQDCLNHNKKSALLDVSRAVDALRIREAIQQSCLTGQTVTLSGR